MLGRLYLFLKTLFLLLTVFFYVYPVLFAFVPFGLRTRTLYAIAGGVVIFFQNYGSLTKGIYCISRGTWRLIIISSLVTLATICSLAINSTTEILYLYMPFSALVVLFAAYFVVHCFKVLYKEVSFEILARYMVGAVMLQMLFAIVFFLLPEFMLFCNELLAFGELERRAMEDTIGLRIQGFGTNFFEAGVVNSCSLLLIFTMLKYENTKRNVLYYIIALLLITGVGAMMSRTTLVGFCFGFLILFYNSFIFRFRISFKFFRVFKYILYIVCIVAVFLLFIPQNQLVKFDTVTKFGFEMFVNYMESGKFETASSNELKEVFIFPDEAKTILIGDGLLTDPHNPEFAYYKNTDVGFSRLVYYFGIIGTLAFFIFYFYLCYQTKLRNDKKYGIFFIMLFVLLLMLHLKGCTNIMFFIMIFYFLNDRREKCNPELI